MTDHLESRVRRLEDRALISETVTKYAVAVDRRDWVMFAGCFTDHMVRTKKGWRIERLRQHISWREDSSPGS